MPRSADPVTGYAKRVGGGKIVAGPLVRAACERHLRDLKRKHLRWRLEKALHAIEFFAETLTLEDRRPFILEPFLAFIVGSLWGWYGEDGFRRFRTAFCEIGKGNAKTPTAAGIGLLGLVADGEGSPEVYAAATTREQARICFGDAVGFVERNPELADLVQHQVGSLSMPSTRGVFRPVSSEHKGLDGLRVHIGLIDELHEHPAAIVVDKIRAGTKGRRNALIFEITNSGWDRTSVCWAHHEYSRKVLEGALEDDSWFAYVCALDAEDDWTDERVWIKTNPGIDKVLPRKYLRELVREAKGMPSKENIVRRLNFCEWTEQEDRAIPMEVWKLGDVPVDEAAMVGRRCFGGLDLASVSDMAALGLLFGPDDEGFYDFVLRCWAPDAAILENRDLYEPWQRAGWLRRTPGEVTDYGFIEAQILEDVARFQPKEIAFDRWNSSYLVTRVNDELRGSKTLMVEFGQGFASMNNPTKELLRLLPDGKIRHGGNPVLAWMASNLALATDPAGNIKPDKDRSGSKIDGIVALIQALGRAIQTPPKRERSMEVIACG